MTDEALMPEDPWTADDRMRCQTFLQNRFVAGMGGIPNIEKWRIIHETLGAEEELDLLWTAEAWSDVFAQVYTEVTDPKVRMAYYWIAELRGDFFENAYSGDTEKADFEYHASSVWSIRLMDLHTALEEGVPREEVRHDWIH